MARYVHFTWVSVMGELKIFLCAVVCYDNVLYIAFHKEKPKCNRRPVSYTLAFCFMYRQ